MRTPVLSDVGAATGEESDREFIAAYPDSGGSHSANSTSSAITDHSDTEVVTTVSQ
jgi:hypothetical protein